MRRSAGLIMGGLMTMAAAPGDITVAEAWTKAAGLGANTGLFMTIRNPGAEDALLRTRCTAATFTEPHTLDRGEGFPSMRVVKSIPVGTGETVLQEDGVHVMLLQTTRALSPGDSFECNVTFRNAGMQTIQVMVGEPGQAAPHPTAPRS